MQNASHKHNFEGYKKALKKMKKLAAIKKCDNCDCNSCGKYFALKLN